jgi:transporter family-2 protein
MDRFQGAEIVPRFTFPSGEGETEMIVLLLLAIAMGVVLPVQAGVNAQLRTVLGSPLAAALVSFLVGSASLALLTLVAREPLHLASAWAHSLWWYWIGGLLGAIYVAGIIVLAPRLGAATLIAAVVAGQMITSLVLDQYGWVGFPSHPISPARLAGAALIIGGVLLVRR